MSVTLPSKQRSLLRPVILLLCATAIYILLPSCAHAQNTGRIECARSDDYVYLYSSMTTLQVRANLQCGEIVYITLRYEFYYGVRTAKGDTGFVPEASVVIIKDQPGTGLPAPLSELPREKMHYDKRPREATTPPVVAPTFTLAKGTPVRVKLVKSLSSATGHVGDAVELEVLDDVQVQGVTVLAKGTKESGVIAEAEPKKRFGHGGRLAFSVSSLRLADGEQAPLRAYEEASGAAGTSSSAVLSSKEATLQQNAEFTLLVDAPVHLKREAFEQPPDPSGVPAARPEAAPAKP
jgi:hypothetical protein